MKKMREIFVDPNNKGFRESMGITKERDNQLGNYLFEAARVWRKELLTALKEGKEKECEHITTVGYLLSKLDDVKGFECRNENELAFMILKTDKVMDRAIPLVMAEAQGMGILDSFHSFLNELEKLAQRSKPKAEPKKGAEGMSFDDAIKFTDN